MSQPFDEFRNAVRVCKHCPDKLTSHDSGLCETCREEAGVPAEREKE